MWWAAGYLLLGFATYGALIVISDEPEPPSDILLLLVLWPIVVAMFIGAVMVRIFRGRR